MLTRSSKSKLFGIMAISVLVGVGLILLGLIGMIAVKGLPAISFDFLTTPARNFGASGGIAYQIAGSLLIVTVAGFLVLPISLGLAIFMSEYLKSPQARKFAQTALLTINTIPSITFGIFGLVFFVYMLGTGISWFIGAIVLALMIMPTVAISSYQSINAIPTIFRENAYALGFDQSQTIRHVLLPQGFHGALTGLIIGVARAVGETAPIMFIATAFSGATLPRALHEPVLTLPTHILALSQQATDPYALQNAWGSAFILIVIVMIFSITGLVFRLGRSKG